MVGRLYNMQIFSSFIAFLIHSIISAGSFSMWPVSQWKSTQVTGGILLLKSSLIIGMSHNMTWHLQSEGEAPKVMRRFHQPQTLYLFTNFSNVPNKKKWTEWIQQKVYLRTDFSLFSPGKNNMRLPLGMFLTRHAGFPMLLRILFVLPDALGSYFLQFT